MKKSVLMVITLICMLWLLNCNRVSFTKAHLGHWKWEDGSFFISENKIYVLTDEKISSITNYTIKSENKETYQKVIIIEDGEAEFTFSDHYKTLTVLGKEESDNKFILTFVDNIQKPSEKLIIAYEKREKNSANISNLKNIAMALDMYAGDNKDVYPNDSTPAAKDHILIKEGYLRRAITDPMTGKDYTFKLITKDHYILSCPNPEEYEYKEIYYDSEGGVKKIR